MKKQLILSLFLSLSLFGNEAETYFDNPNSDTLKTVLTDINAEPSSIVAGCVNVITGDYVEFDVDLIIPGPEPIRIQRSYSSSDTGTGILHRSWRSNFQSLMTLKFDHRTRHQTATASYLGGCGERMHFEGSGYKDDDTLELKPLKSMYKHGLTNTSKGAISGQTHPKNSRIIYDNESREKCILSLGSGEKHRFRRYGSEHHYLLREITKPSGLQLHYTYDKDKLAAIEFKNRAGQIISKARILHDPFPKTAKDEHWVAFHSPDGRAVNYRFQDFSNKRDYYILTDVQRSDGPCIHYILDEAEVKKQEGSDWSGHMERIKRKELPDGRFVEVDYYVKGDNYVRGKNFKIDSYSSKRCNRVKEIKLPASEDGKAISCYKFVYNILIGTGQTKTTIVYDPYDRVTEYNYNQEDHLTHIVEFDQNGSAYTIERLFWGEPETSRQINLQWRVFGEFHSSSKEYARAYEYDGKGNVVKDTLFGILTGANLQTLQVDSSGAPVENGCERKTRSYTYTDLNCVQTMLEDGITTEYKYVPGTSLVEAVFYKDSQGIFRRCFYSYDHNAQVIEEIIDDANHEERSVFVGATQRFITRTERTNQYPVGLPIKEVKSCVDLESGVELPLQTLVQSFDSRGRMIKQETFGSDGNYAYSKEWIYDDYGNLTHQIDPLGRLTYRQYDANGNCTLEEGPLPGLRNEMVYDYMNRLIFHHEHHGDGITLSKRNFYDLKGNKTVAVDALGNSTHYRYDAFGRVVKVEGPGIRNLNDQWVSNTTSFEYNALSQLVKQTDSKGNSLSKKYTIFGKPYEVVHPDGTVERIKYNLRGEPIESIAPSGAITRYVRDDRGRVLKTELFSTDGSLYSVSERRYDQSHLLEEIDSLGNKTQHTYDVFGRLKSTQNQTAIVEYEYDALGRRICTVHMSSDRSQGTVTRLKLDAVGQILEERIEDISGELFTLSTFTYDEIGRKIETTVGDATSRFKYDTHGVLVESIDPEGNVTTCTADYHYFNAHGQRVLKTCTTDPKGVQTVICYDILGNKSSIERFDPFGNLLLREDMIYDLNGNLLQKTATPEPKRVYRFTYDSMNRLVDTYQAFGTPDQKVHSYHYNALGQKETVIKPDGVALHFTYDCFGRSIAVSSSDETVNDLYIYDAANNPIEIHNLVTNKMTLRSFDAQGKLL